MFETKRSQSLCSKEGFNDWNHLSQTIKIHEKSVSHLDNFATWKEHLNRILGDCTIDHCLDKQVLDERKRLKPVFERLVAITLYLARQNIAFAGKTTTSGNFYELVQTIAQFDVVMQSHLEKVSRKKYLTPQTQNELIARIGKKIRNKLLSDIIQSKYYSILLDCTSDISRTEQMTLVLRYVYFDSMKRLFQIKESFIEYIKVTDKTGQGMANVSVNELERFELDVMDMRGQGYDNGASMLGKHKGVQRRIRDLNPLAEFIPCCNHSLNLSLNDAASASSEIDSFFSIVQRVFTFLSASTNRWDIVKRHCASYANLKPKQISTTRWSARFNAVKPLRRNLNKILASLDEIRDSEAFDNSARNDAASIANEIDYKFICSVCIWYNILEQFERASKYLQKVTMNVGSAVLLLKNIKEFLESYKLTGYDKAVEEANMIAEEVQVPAIFESERRGRPRNIPIEPEQRFKTDFFEFLINAAQDSIGERFETFSTHSESYAFLYEFEHYDERYENGSLLVSCNKLEEKLRRDDTSDVDGGELCNELRIIGKLLKDTKADSVIDVLNLIVKQNLESVLPNAVIAFRILLTLPVSVATGERTFSRLKLIKTYLRNTMHQERLSDLAIISIEKDTAKDLDYDDIINELANEKAKK